MHQFVQNCMPFRLSLRILRYFCRELIVWSCFLTSVICHTSYLLLGNFLVTLLVRYNMKDGKSNCCLMFSAIQVM